MATEQDAPSHASSSKWRSVFVSRYMTRNKVVVEVEAVAMACPPEPVQVVVEPVSVGKEYDVEQQRVATLAQAL